jgi:hypothetical protein
MKEERALFQIPNISSMATRVPKGIGYHPILSFANTSNVAKDNQLE